MDKKKTKICINNAIVGGGSAVKMLNNLSCPFENINFDSYSIAAQCNDSFSFMLQYIASYILSHSFILFETTGFPSISKCNEILLDEILVSGIQHVKGKMNRERKKASNLHVAV